MFFVRPVGREAFEANQAPRVVLRATHEAALYVETRILAKNDAQAAKNRAWFAGREILALNLISSPGAGKTTLLERTIRDLAGELSLYVIEGDQAVAKDGERIRNAGASVVQVNTGTGCHLDAEMVTRAVSVLKPGLRNRGPYRERRHISSARRYSTSANGRKS